MENNKWTCPFPGECDLWECDLPGQCRVSKQKPLIVCSEQSRRKGKIELEEKAIQTYLDRHINLWNKMIKEEERNSFAVFFRDAYQKLRKDLLGEYLTIEEKNDER